MGRPLRLLLSAYACHPNKGSEPGAGWNWVKELSKENELWVLFYSGQGQDKSLQQTIGTLEHRRNIHLVPLGVPKFLEKRLYLIRYEVWQWTAYKVAKELVEKVNIDLIHHVTISAWWNCGHLWKLKLPFIFGPILGAQQTPLAGYAFLRLRDQAYELLRWFVFHVSWAVWPRPRRAMKRAKVVLVGNLDTEAKVRKVLDGDSVRLVSAAGVSRSTIEDPSSVVREEIGAIVLLWSGSLIPRKNFGLLLRVLVSLPPDLEWSLRVAGDGKLMNYWKKEVQAVHLHDRVVFLGRIEHSEMAREYRRTDVFVFPSLREGTPAVLIEAMSHGLPIIALDIHGARVLCDNSTAILIPVESKKQMMKDFRDAIVKLYNDPELRRTMGQAGRRKAEENYLWEKRGQTVNEIYRIILDKVTVKSRTVDAQP